MAVGLHSKAVEYDTQATQLYHQATEGFTAAARFQDAKDYTQATQLYHQATESYSKAAKFYNKMTEAYTKATEVYSIAATACAKVAEALSIDRNWVKQRYDRLRNEYRTCFPIDLSLIDLLYASAVQNPRAAFSHFFRTNDWEKQHLVIENERPVKCTFKVEGEEFTASDDIQETAVQRVMESALSFLIRNHPIHFNRFRQEDLPMSSGQDAIPTLGVLLTNLEHFLGTNYYIKCTNQDPIQVEMCLKNNNSAVEWSSTVVATGTSDNPIPDFKKAAASSNAEQTAAHAAFSKAALSASHQAAEGYLKTADLPVKKYFADLFEKYLGKLPTIGSIKDIRKIISDYLDGDWLGYSNRSVYLAPTLGLDYRRSANQVFYEKLRLLPPALMGRAKANQAQAQYALATSPWSTSFSWEGNPADKSSSETDNAKK